MNNWRIAYRNANWDIYLPEIHSMNTTTNSVSSHAGRATLSSERVLSLHDLFSQLLSLIDVFIEHFDLLNDVNVFLLDGFEDIDIFSDPNIIEYASLVLRWWGTSRRSSRGRLCFHSLLLSLLFIIIRMTRY
jgi:hypothetical protein